MLAQSGGGDKLKHKWAGLMNCLLVLRVNCVVKTVKRFKYIGFLKDNLIKSSFYLHYHNALNECIPCQV